MISPPSSLSTTEQPSRSESSEINSVSSDVLLSHILTRLDGVSLAALSCSCSLLYSLCSEESLWKKKCLAMWPSTVDTHVQRVISTFPAGHRSFFYDSFPFLTHSGEIYRSPSDETTELISAVDIFYKDEVIFSRVHVTETTSGWFLCSPVRFDLVKPRELISTRVLLTNQWEVDTWKTDLEENLSLSWIVIDPTRKRAANVSTRKSVSVHRHWLTGEVHVRFSTIFVFGKDNQSEQVEFTVTVVLGAISRREEDIAEMQIREVSLVAKDMEGMNLGGRDILVILTAAMSEKRRPWRRGIEEGKEKYRQFMNMKTEKKDMKWRQEKEMVSATTPCFVAVVIFGFLLCIYLFIHKYSR